MAPPTQKKIILEASDDFLAGNADDGTSNNHIVVRNKNHRISRIHADKEEEDDSDSDSATSKRRRRKGGHGSNRGATVSLKSVVILCVVGILAACGLTVLFLFRFRSYPGTEATYDTSTCFSLLEEQPDLGQTNRLLHQLSAYDNSLFSALRQPEVSSLLPSSSRDNLRAHRADVRVLNPLINRVLASPRWRLLWSKLPDTRNHVCQPEIFVSAYAQQLSDNIGHLQSASMPLAVLIKDVKGFSETLASARQDLEEERTRNRANFMWRMGFETEVAKDKELCHRINRLGHTTEAAELWLEAAESLQAVLKLGIDMLQRDVAIMKDSTATQGRHLQAVRGNFDNLMAIATALDQILIQEGIIHERCEDCEGLKGSGIEKGLLLIVVIALLRDANQVVVNVYH